MAVTTGTTTGTTNSSSGSSNNPTGGSLQAPARTEPSKSTTPSGNASTGQGGQGSTSSSSSTSSTPSSSGSSSGTSQSGTESSSNTTTDASTNTTTATKSEPSTDTALKSPTQQAEVNKQKEAYTDYGGAYTTIDAPPALPQASKQESVKVVDPARSSSSNNGTTTGTGGQNQTVAGGKTDNTATQPTSASGKTDSQATTSTAKPTTTPAMPSGTSTAWGGGITAPQTPAPGKTSNPNGKVNPSGTDTAWAGDLTNPATPAAGKTDKQPTPTVAGLSGTSTLWGGPTNINVPGNPPSLGPTRGLTAADVNAPPPVNPSGTTTSWAPPLPSSMWTPNINQSMQENWLDSTVSGNILDTLTGGVLQQGTLPTTIPQQMEGFGTNAGNYIDSIFGGGVGSIAPGATTEAMMRTPGMSYGNPAPNSGLSYQDPTAVAPAGSYTPGGSILGMQPVRNSMTPAQAIAQDPIGYNGPRVGTAPPSAPTPSVVNPSSAAVADLENRVLQAQQGTLMAPYGQPPAKIVDRVPPQAPNYPTVTDPRTAQMQEQFNTPQRAPLTSAPVSPSIPQLGYGLDPSNPTQQQAIDRALINTIHATPEPQQQGLLGNPLAGGTLVSSIDQARADAFAKIAAARGQAVPDDRFANATQVSTTTSPNVVPTSGPVMFSPFAGKDIGMVYGSSIARPNINGGPLIGFTPNIPHLNQYGNISGNYDDSQYSAPLQNEPAAPDVAASEPLAPVQQGIVNPYHYSPAAQAQAVQDLATGYLLSRPPTAPMPPAAPQQPAPQLGVTGSPIMVAPNLGQVKASNLAIPDGAHGGRMLGTTVGSPSLDQYGNLGVGYEGDFNTFQGSAAPASPAAPITSAPQQASPVTVTNPEAPVPPSQEGDYPPNENPSQVAGQPQTVGELYNRDQYEKERAKQGFYDLPGNLFNAITSGDIRGYTPDPNDRGTDPLPYGIHPGTHGTGNSAMLAQQAALINRLVAMLRQQQLGVAPSQADLVFNTFV